MADIKRQTAHKCKIKQVLEAKYVQQQGWAPNYLEMNGMHVGRINIIAAIVSKENNTITVDDGTGQINLILFQEQERANNLDVADIILIIGRPREYQNQRYIVPEIMKIVQDKKWIEYRRKELEIQEQNQPQQPKQSQDTQKTTSQPIKNAKKSLENTHTEQNQTTQPENQAVATEEIFVSAYNKKSETTSDKIINAIRKLDEGPGANIEDIIEEVNGSNEETEKYISILINEGEIFEIRAGRLKILD